MCNFMGVRVTKIQFVRLLKLEKELGTLAAMEELKKMQDGFTYSNSIIIRNDGKGDMELVKAHWEFIPAWIKDMDAMKDQRKKGIPWLNAKAENLLLNEKGLKAMWADAAKKRRCLVLATHFFEWRHYKPEGEKKEIAYPYTIGLNDADYFYMAAIWQPWTDKNTGETMDTFAIVTTKANLLMQEVHNTKKRMPTILPEELAHEWIMEDLSEERIKEIASYQLPSELMYAHPIAKEFKILEEPCEEYVYDELPALDIAL